MWLADLLFNPNLPTRGYGGARVVYCPGSHTTDHLFSTTRIPSTPDTGCDARQTHCLLPLRPGRKPPVATSLNLAYSQECASTNPDCNCPGGAAWRRQIGLLWERLSQLVDLGLVFCGCPRTTHWCPHSVQGSACTEWQKVQYDINVHNKTLAQLAKHIAQQVWRQMLWWSGLCTLMSYWTFCQWEFVME